jgi:peptidyl-Asp metalloendopeptidase
MITRITLSSLLLLSGIASAHAAEPLFFQNSAPKAGISSAMAAPGSPFAGERKAKSARVGMQLNPGAAAAAELAMPLPDGGQFNARRATSYRTASGATVWVGKHSNAEAGTAASAEEETVLVIREGKVTGTVRHAGKLYRIRAGVDGTHGVAEIDTSKFPRDHSEPEYRQQLQLQLNQAAELPAPTSMVGNFRAALAETPVIRVLVNYTPAAKGTTSDILALIDLAIAETNQGYLNSGVNARVELAHAAQVNYTESGSNSTDRSRYADVDDRVMDEIHTQRNTYAADVGVLLTDGNSACGNGTIYASATSAFAAVTTDCATGNYSFGHELGHVFGARHNPEEDSSTTPYAWGHGYLSPNRNWRTIMAYDCPNGCKRLNYWSNPNKTRDGVAMGTTTKNNNARVLNERAAVLAGFRSGGSTTTPVVVSNTGDYTIPDNNSSGVSSPVTVATAGNAGSVTAEVNIIHPYIGDLVVDLIGPDGVVYNLQNRAGGSADNIQKSFNVAVGAKSRLGTWKLRVTDRAAQDTGHIESWTFKSQ